jgi:cell division septum initiation protein DivIVA
VSDHDDTAYEGQDEPKSAALSDTIDVGELLDRLLAIVEAARPVPLSASSMINKDEVLELLNEAADGLPDELRAARWLLKEREEFLSKVRREGDEILELARAQAERMVQRTEVGKAAESRARTVVDDAEAESRKMRHEVEDWCDQKLGSFEIVLEKTMNAVAAGRARLQGDVLERIAAQEDEVDEAEEAAARGFFDQDDS